MANGSKFTDHMNIDNFRLRLSELLTLDIADANRLLRPEGERAASKRVLLNSLCSFDVIYIHTRNSIYRIYLLSPVTLRVMIQGGRHFPDSVEAIIRGANLGGYLHTDGSIEVGFGLEFCVDGKRIITSPVESFLVERRGNDQYAAEQSSS